MLRMQTVWLAPYHGPNRLAPGQVVAAEPPLSLQLFDTKSRFFAFLRLRPQQNQALTTDLLIFL